MPNRTQLGVYVGNEPEHFARFEAWIGQEAAPLGYVGGGTWEDIASPGWVIDMFHDADTVFWSVPLIPEDGTTLAQAASGAFNDYYRRCAEGLADQKPMDDGKVFVRTGWEMGGDGVRTKDGRRLSILYQTSTNSVRQAAQALIKQWWNELGVEVELRNIDAAVFFGGDPGSPDTLQKFYADVEMYANNFDGTDPEKYLGDWVCSEFPEPASQWQGGNTSRFCSEEYDALHAEMGKTAGLEERGKIAIQLNDMIVNSASFIPLVHRGRVSTKSNALGGVVMNPWDSELWNAADWYRVQ